MKILRWNRLTRLFFVVTVLSLSVAATLVPANVSACESEWYQTFYAEAEKINVVGECWRPCFGWASCSGTRTDYYDIVSWDCGCWP